jgi:hypothetical protein
MANHTGIRAIPKTKHQLAAISKILWLPGDPEPTKSYRVKSTLRGAGRLRGKPIQTKKPLTKDILFNIIVGVEMITVRDYRDKAMLLVSFAGAFVISRIRLCPLACCVTLLPSL